jgi:hypothetical protein
MLRTGKQVWEATAKRSALGIRHEELGFHIERYSVLVTQCSVLAGFAFESIVHLDVPEDTRPDLSAWYFVSLSFCVMFSVYVIVCGSCLIVLGHQLALLGEDGDSLEHAVTHLRSRRFPLFSAGFCALASLLSGGGALAWIKMGPAALFVSAAFAVFGFLTFTSVTSIFCAIGDRKLVTGATKLYTPTGYFDLATLQPGVGNHTVLSQHEKDGVPDVV